MADTTTRFALPMLVAGQAQKEITHNEALALVDALLHPVVETMALSTPPSAPVAGQGWIVAAAPSGAWAGHAAELAVWTDGGWRFAVPTEAMTIWVRDLGLHARRTGSAWTAGTIAMLSLRCNGVQVVGPRQPAVAAAAGGATVDAEARSTLAAVLSTLRNHGLIATA